VPGQSPMSAFPDDSMHSLRDGIHVTGLQGRWLATFGTTLRGAPKGNLVRKDGYLTKAVDGARPSAGHHFGKSAGRRRRLAQPTLLIACAFDKVRINAVPADQSQGLNIRLENS